MAFFILRCILKEKQQELEMARQKPTRIPTPHRCYILKGNFGWAIPMLVGTRDGLCGH